MKKSEFIRIYWKNYQKFEKFFIDTDKYVTIDKDNNDAFSFEYLSLFVLICNEIDAVLNELCDCFEKERQRNIGLKMSVLRANIPNLRNAQVETLPEYGRSYVPYSGFSDEESGDWWKSYNNIKHSRSKIDKKTKKPYYQQANLKNVFESLSALYLALNLLFEMCEDDTDVKLESRVFGKINI